MAKDTLRKFLLNREQQLINEIIEKQEDLLLESKFGTDLEIERLKDNLQDIKTVIHYCVERGNRF